MAEEIIGEKKAIFPGISKITVKNFKSYSEEKSIDIRPLTILAGSNSSGKSSIFQPLLMMKQTLENSYDPGPLLMEGPHVQFTRIDQILSKIDTQNPPKEFSVSIETENSLTFSYTYKKSASGGFKIHESEFRDNKSIKIKLRPNWSHNTILKNSQFIRHLYDSVQKRFECSVNDLSEEERKYALLKVKRNRCFLELDDIRFKQKSGGYITSNLYNSKVIEGYITSIIHLPALRGNPKRLYPKTAIGSKFPGTFEHYTAGIITHWEKKGKNKLRELRESLKTLGISNSVETSEIDETSAEIRVSLLPPDDNKKKKSVSIADVGFGVSQTLPILVALIVAEEGQLVYIEQPEIHLHPLAQYKLADVLVNAANRGVKVVIETHSDILILGIQTLVAEKKIDKERIILHWFKRDDDGSTQINSSELNVNGAYNNKNWPIDFGNVRLFAAKKFLDAKDSDSLNRE